LKLPFVSRERFDEERARRQKAESELDAMRDKFLAYIESQSAPAPVIGADTDLSKITPINGRPTIANVIATANRDAYKASQIPGAKSVAAQLEESQKKLLQIKREVNGH
jgi:hypothetical protein